MEFDKGSDSLTEQRRKSMSLKVKNAPRHRDIWRKDINGRPINLFHRGQYLGSCVSKIILQIPKNLLKIYYNNYNSTYFFREDRRNENTKKLKENLTKLKESENQ
ncbi:hypothetical protein ACNF42_01330 [Cuniculiplasma sp. SKW3]|uniref:hypothetical protein n=1 Tax=Cuniculiplasma sp. SKW3 TaxID=3400170 RepID=UPI003FD110C5